jgi:hypothetical protein
MSHVTTPWIRLIIRQEKPSSIISPRCPSLPECDRVSILVSSPLQVVPRHALLSFLPQFQAFVTFILLLSSLLFNQSLDIPSLPLPSSFVSDPHPSFLRSIPLSPFLVFHLLSIHISITVMTMQRDVIVAQSTLASSAVLTRCTAHSRPSSAMALKDCQDLGVRGVRRALMIVSWRRKDAVTTHSSSDTAPYRAIIREA